MPLCVLTLTQCHILLRILSPCEKLGPNVGDLSRRTIREEVNTVVLNLQYLPSQQPLTERTERKHVCKIAVSYVKYFLKQIRGRQAKH
jgi:hypothetical protein